MSYQTPITIAKALEKIHRHEYVIPAIQREFVWDPDQMCRLFDSLLRGYPIGTFALLEGPRQAIEEGLFVLRRGTATTTRCEIGTMQC